MRRAYFNAPIFIIVSVMTRIKSIETLLLLSSSQPNNAAVYYSLGKYYTLIGESKKPKTILIFTINLKKNNSAIN